MKTAEQCAEELKEAMGDNCKSVILYGSAAAGDHAKAYSDINLLVVVQDMGLSSLKAAMPVVKKWIKNGNPPPLFFTQIRITEAEDVFPIEFLDIKATHRVLLGEDPFRHLEISTKNLRHQLEYELRGKLIQLRERYLSTDGKPKQIQELLARSVSTFAILFKGVLRLLGEVPPQSKAEVLPALHKHVGIEVDALQTILRLRAKDKQALKENPEALLESLLKSVEAVVDFVDKYK